MNEEHHKRTIVFESSSEDSDSPRPDNNKSRSPPSPPATQTTGSANKKPRVSMELPKADGSVGSSSTGSARNNPVFAVKPRSDAVRNVKNNDSPKSNAAAAGLARREEQQHGSPNRPEVPLAFDADALTKKHAIPDSSTDDEDEPGEVVTKYVTLEENPVNSDDFLARLPLSQIEVRELEVALGLDPKDGSNGWRDDWSGDLLLAFDKVPNPSSRVEWYGEEKPFVDWPFAGSPGDRDSNLRLFHNFLKYLNNRPGTPPAAQHLLRWAYAAATAGQRGTVNTILRRINYDPQVLREDGWTIKKSKESIGATGGPHNIGMRVVWQKYDAVVIGYLHDPDIGDLWRAMWLEDDFETFDLEAEELQRAQRSWQRKSRPEAVREKRDSARVGDTSNFNVDGIEHGIVLAQSFAKNVRPGVLWPARVVHATEERSPLLQSKRSSVRQKLHVVFLAPYWNALDEYGQPFQSASAAYSHTGPLLEADQVEISDDTIQKYPEDGEHGLNIDRLRSTFRFTGLPKSIFPRFLDAHRLALALKTYAKRTLRSSTYMASAALLDTHPMSIKTPEFPSAVLHLPFVYILSKLPSPEKHHYTFVPGTPNIEPILDIASIMKAMEPPSSWGLKVEGSSSSVASGGSRSAPLTNGHKSDHLLSPGGSSLAERSKVVSRSPTSPRVTVDNITSEFLRGELHRNRNSFPVTQLSQQLDGLISQLWNEDVADSSSCPIEWTKISTFLRDCLLIKGHGEDIIGSIPEGPQSFDKAALVREWRQTCERLYREASCQFSSAGLGNGATIVITDSRCNEHITKGGAFERPVRLPAALKACRLAKSDMTDGTLHILNRVKDSYIEAAKRIIPKAHSTPYIERMKLKCAALPEESSGVPLTENSEGDTTGSRGSFTAALAGVAAAIKGVDMIVGGQCVNAFCATRPPGHHAGRHMHPMKATSNGFCILNPAACAALYAATPISDGGMGLRRVCVIDFDVHHGNGTQDVLCSTYDPRFFYVSLHAGGPQYNGIETEDDSEFGYRSSVGASGRGIFPGRCGDTSPHRGVLNIPLGGKFTAMGVGNALVSQVAPRVEDFSPDLIILSAGFDGHKFDPLRLGGLSAEDYGHITQVACDMAHSFCGGRVLSILEGGYGVPCCRPQEDLFLPQSALHQESSQLTNDSAFDDEEDENRMREIRPQPTSFADLGDDLPSDMDDQVTYDLQKSLEKCHAEGFQECVREHVRSLGVNNRRTSAVVQQP